MKTDNRQQKTEDRIKIPEERGAFYKLKAGDKVFLSGIIYTARDEAHRRIAECGIENAEFPFEIKDQVIYYTGPSPTKPGEVIGSCGPTTSARMDKWTPFLLSLGLAGMIGKGPRSIEVMDVIKKYQAVYFIAIGGAAAYYTNFISSAEIIAYPDLGCEAIHRLEVKDFPLYVGISPDGKTIF
ncbi:MAG: FumA C-terminus/TtdB family hydratase beta subunit [bacterium]